MHIVIHKVASDTLHEVSVLQMAVERAQVEAAHGTDEPGRAVPEVESNREDDVDGMIGFARLATEKEHNMTLLQGVRLYPKAIAWSVLISTCIVMEGYV